MPVIRIAPPPQPFDPRVAIERIFKPFEEYQKRRDQALAKRREPVVLDEEEAEICWGQPGNFNFDDIPTTGTTVKLKEDEDKEKDKSILNWSEDSRQWKTIRVENPDDPDQYVMIDRIDWITFTAPGNDIKTWPNRKHKFTLKHPDKKKK